MKICTAFCWKEGRNKGEMRQNEDSLLLEQVRFGRESIVFAAVFDGIGGLQQGENASGFLAENLQKWFLGEGLEISRHFRNRKKRWLMFRKSLNRELYCISEKMYSYARNQNCRMGTTCSVVLLINRRYLVCSVGDSYVLKCSKKRISCLNRPDVNEKGQLVRCMGSEGWYPLQFITGRLNPWELLLVVTDGYGRKLRSEDIRELFQKSGKCFLSKKNRKKKIEYQMKNWLETTGCRMRNRGEQDDMTAVAIREVV